MAGSGYNPCVTYRQIFIISILTLHHGTMDLRDHGVGTRDIVLELGNDGVCFHDVVANVGGSRGPMRASRRRRQ